MQECLYFKNGLCNKEKLPVDVLDTERGIACCCVEHDIMRVLQKCKLYVPAKYTVAYVDRIKEGVKQVKQIYTLKDIRDTRNNKLIEELDFEDYQSDENQLCRLIVLLQNHNFKVIPKEVRLYMYPFIIELGFSLDKDMKLDRNKLLKKS